MSEMYKMLALVMTLVILANQVAGCSIEEEITRISVREAVKSELEMKKEVETLRSEMLEMKRDVAWYSLHVAATAACRGSTETGGHGPHGNVVLPKQNTKSCADQCGETEYSVCDADVAIHGSFGKATSYTENVGQFYNYGCATPGNTSPLFDEVKADEDGVFDLDVQPVKPDSRYYRFCCCRYV